jgi:hypothetical protein
MNKLIILTPSIIRGNLHTRSIGKFYDFFYQYFEKYDIFHIINIDEPENLKKYFNKYETIGLYNQIIPCKVNKIFITEPNPGFLQAWKKIVKKIEELNLIGDSYLYYWLEDDWEPRTNYNIANFFNQLGFKNSAYTFTDRAPLGSFRGGPFMTGSYFSNIFNIRKYMNETCDPERQMQRWLRGGYQKNGNSSIYRFNIINQNISNEHIYIIIVCDETNINLSDLNKHHYNSGFDNSIKFSYHLITYNSNSNSISNLKYSKVINSSDYNLNPINKDGLNKIFLNNYIKYFIIKPSIMFDIGREFNNEYGLQKWMKIEDNTSYTNITFYNANLGNDLGLEEEQLRLNPEFTSNINFIEGFESIIKCLPYLEKEYFNKEIKLNINWYSHIYGNYPNFNIIGDLIQLNYIPTINKSNQKFEELLNLKKISNNLKNNLIANEINNYLYKYFKFNKDIINKVQLFVDNNFKGIVFGINCCLVKKHNYDEKIITILEHLKNNIFDNVFIFTCNNEIKNKLLIDLTDYNMIFYEDNQNNEFDKLERINVMNKIIEEIKNENNLDKLIELENQLKKESIINNKILENLILNYLILLKCNIYENI